MYYVSREQIERADIILGVNKVNGNETVFYGASMLKLIAGGDEGPKGHPLNVLRVPLDFDSDDPERLAAACLALKGSCDAPRKEG